MNVYVFRPFRDLYHFMIISFALSSHHLISHFVTTVMLLAEVIAIVTVYCFYDKQDIATHIYLTIKC